MATALGAADGDGGGVVGVPSGDALALAAAVGLALAVAVAIAVGDAEFEAAGDGVGAPGDALADSVGAGVAWATIPATGAPLFVEQPVTIDTAANTRNEPVRNPRDDI